MRNFVYAGLVVIGLVLCRFPLHSCQSHVGTDVFENTVDVMMKIKCSPQDKELKIKPAFFASLRPQTNLGTNTAVKFDNVQTNIGNGYDPTAGTFTAPLPGVYEISCNFMKLPNDEWLELNLMKNEKLIARGHCDKTQFSSGSLRVILELAKGDRIYINHPRSFGGIHGMDYSMLSGHMI